ncbi:MAG TPA: glycosyltransferase family 1 protein [Xylanibacter oryzae]|nr:glycosyltransferase family 1 protein [Xylanibacter oryzae]
MRIGIEAQRIFRKEKHGMDYVVLEEIKHLQKMNLEDTIFVFVKSDVDKCLKDSENVHIIELKRQNYLLWEQYVLPKEAKKYNLDILHCTSDTAPIFCNIPIVLTLHDIIFLESRDKSNKSLYQNLGWMYRRFVVPKVLKKCKRIITVSNFEYKNIKSKLALKDKLIMIYNGYNEWFMPLEDKDNVYKKYTSEKGYFLFLGNTDPKKNTERTLIAYSKYLKNSSIKRKLLIADLEPQYLDYLLKKNNIEEIRDNIESTGYIINSDLAYLYNDAFAFLYTSLRESFGIPIIEAMACGTPVITSNTSSMPEIAGKSAILINPENTDDISNSMITLENDKNKYDLLKKTGLERAKLFSWKNNVKRLVKVYKETHEENIQNSDKD